MKKKALVLLLLAMTLTSSATAFAAGENYETYAAYNVQVPDTLKVPFAYSTDDFFNGGLVTGFGSAVTFKGVDKDGNLQFYAITDRGPNADAAKYIANGKENSSKVFPCPTFTPSIGVITLKDGNAVVESAISIKDSAGNPITGLPLAPGSIGSTNEIGLDMELNQLPYDVNGLDTEGIAVDADGNFWICDEYGPFLTKISPNGTILEKYAPGQGLPEVLKYRIANRGFEGLTITPAGKVMISVQSVLDVNGETSKNACFTRMIEFDPATGKTKIYAYPVDVSAYKSPKDCKIGDIYAIDDDTLLVIEQGKLKDKSMSNIIYKVELDGATDISNMHYEGKELEYADQETLQKNMQFLQKAPYINLREAGWTAEKAEGICMLPDQRTIAVINDNDFGIVTETKDSKNEDPDITDYVYDGATKEYSLDGKKADVTFSIGENTEPAQIWLFKTKS